VLVKFKLDKIEGCVSELPLVSVVIPCRNEEKHIGMCLDSLLANDYPRDRIEFLVVDGMSEDGTRAIVADYLRKNSSLRLVDNEKKSIPAAVNLGVKHARGEIVTKIDGHSTYAPDYFTKCVRYLREFDADNVGGVLKIRPGQNTAMAEAIALALGHRFGSGNAYVKVGCKEPRWADAVSFGCFKRQVFDTVGLWNEELAGSPDMDFNQRLKRMGGKILLVPEIVTEYHADADLGALWRHNFADGVWATYVMKFGSRAFSWRHWVPMMFVLAMALGLSLSVSEPRLRFLFPAMVVGYAMANLAASAQVALREKNVRYLFFLPLVFATRHFSHGIGAVWGLILVLLPGRHWKGRRSARA